MKFTSIALILIAPTLTLPVYAAPDATLAKYENAKTEKAQNNNAKELKLAQNNLELVVNDLTTNTHKKIKTLHAHNQRVHKHLTSADEVLSKGIQKNFEYIQINEDEIANLSVQLDEQMDVAKGLQNQFNDFKSEYNLNKDRTNAAIAGVTALSMLPQPTSVGQGNVAIGVGHYMSQTAAAVGFGYSVNENVTLRTGVSYNKTMKRPAFGAAVGVNF